MSERNALRAQIVTREGTPTLQIDGRPQAAIGYLTFHPEARGRFRDFARAGIRLLAVNTTGDYHSYGTASPVAIRPGVFDYHALDRRIGRILRQVPDAALVARVYVGSPPWWDALHPEELLRYEDGACARPLHSGTLKRTIPSFSSRKWRAFAADSLTRLVRHVRASPYGGRVIGYQLMGGETEEWFYHGTYEGYLSDYSAVHQEAFRRWRRRGARGGASPWGRLLARLGRLPGPPGVPAPERRLAPGGGFLLDPRREGDLADYVLFRAREVADTIVRLAGVVKDACRGEALCGAFYGYVLELANHPLGLHHGGHLSFERLLDSPCVDFLSAPTSYLNRGVGSGYSAFMTMTDSLKLHGKLWFNENDSRTHLTPPGYACGRTASARETRAVMRREFAHSMARGAGLWWFDMRGGWYRDPGAMEEAARLQRLGEELVRGDRRSAADLAVLVAGEPLRYFRPGSPLPRVLLGGQIQELGRLGAPFDCFHLRDLPALRPYRAYLILSPLELSRRECAGIRRHLRGGGRTSIWVFAPGVVRRGCLREAGIGEVTGIAVERWPGPAAAAVEVHPGPDPLLAGISKPLVYGAPEPGEPLFVGRGDGGCRVLGRIPRTGAPGLLARTLGDGTSIFSSAPCLPAPLLRSLLAPAGVHFYLETPDVVYGNRSFLAVHTCEGGRRVLRLPETATVRDLSTGRILGRSAREVDLDLPPRHTLLLGLERGDRANRFDPPEEGRL